MGDQSSIMASPSISVSFILSYLLIIFLHLAQAQSKCPKEFLCSNRSIPTFPFTNQSLPDCGLFKLGCNIVSSRPTLELDSKLYNTLILGEEDLVVLSDPVLSDHLKNRSCDSFNWNSSTPFTNSPSISFEVPSLQFLFLFKCNQGSSHHSREMNDYFTGYKSYHNCKNFTLYYKENHRFIPKGKVPKDCSLVQLPFDNSTKSNDLFEELTPEIIFFWKLSEKCSECHNRGGQCQSDSNNNFKCLEGKRKGIVKGGKANLNQITGQDTVGGENKRKMIVIIASSGTGVAVLMILLLCLGRTFSYHLKTRDERNVEVFLKNNESLSPKRYSYSKVKKIASSFKNKLGQGGYGCVYKGQLPNGTLVAVKLLKEAEGSGEEFINEVASISRTFHVNIVTLLGFCFEGRKRALLYEFMPNGSLEKFIYDKTIQKNRQLGWPTLYKIAIGIARGLEYLHRGCKTRILHFDIKPHNILLNEDFCPKISDFGLAKLHTTTESFVSIMGARGTIGYVAPEVACRNIGAISHKSDVYSYGMMVLEMVSGRKNVEDDVDHSSEIYFPHWIYRRIELDRELGLIGIMNDEDMECARKMVVVSLWCIHTDPSIRPSISKVLEMLESNTDSLPFPPKPYLYSSTTTAINSSTLP